MRALYIIAPLSAISKRTRLFKLAQYIFRSYPGCNITHIGWERISGEREESYLAASTLEKEIILKGGGYGGRKIKLLYPVWALKVFFRCLRLNQNAKVWALGLETAFPAVLAGRIKGFQVIFDDADRFSMLLSVPRFLSYLIEKAERFTSKFAQAHVIPGIERYSYSSANFRILKNTPSLSEILRAQEIFRAKAWPKSSLTINVNGWLGAGRGIDKVLALAKAMLDDVRIIVAGKPDCKDAKELILMPNVSYLGEISNAQALASYYASDFVFTYYDPSSAINRLAESNKWGDAMKTGIGVIVNSEVETAKYLLQAGAAISLPYHDVEGLIREMKRLCLDKSYVVKYKEKSIALADKFGYFEDQLDVLFSELDKNDSVKS